MDQTEIELEGQRYVWDGRRWHATKTFQVPPAALASRLNSLLATFLANDDAKITDFNGLLQMAQIARSASQYKRAEAALQRAIALQPASEPAFAILCSVLRQLGAPDRAIRETEHLKAPKFSPLLVSRAAALCDLEKWEEAKTTLDRALATKSSPEALEVVDRIKAQRPDLYESQGALKG